MEVKMNKKRINLQILIILLITYMSVGQIFAQSDKKIAVMPLTCTHDDHGTTLEIENYLVDVLVNLKRFQIIERSQLDKILDEQKLNLDSDISDEDAVQVGKQLGIDYLILGSVLDVSTITTLRDDDDESSIMYKGKVSANIRVVSTETASIIGSITESDESHGPLNGADNPSEQLYSIAAKKLVLDTIKPKLCNLFPLQGYIIQIVGQKKKEIKAVIDLGSEKGIKKKDKFIVFRKFADVKHPVTGEMIPGRIEELGEAEVKFVDSSTAEVKIKIKKQENPVKVGDCVRSKKKKKSFWNKIS